ncbi:MULTISPECIES: M18 family aminopeptidase [Nitrosomonas]|uniref:M18 family aminopeptidase n=1 Tax=Nitrosomonas communis TaxID=44574 RepID=A0A0F7KCS0_9PROT|nr:MULTISPECIES: M18 family aminopeptidase [Nitrosomonas]AKH36604.1 aminopeptidase [Nitrosomonas communis]TYP86065.1 aspartyl aminopeptidase [Nitrosomonas communis]UVS61622.1 M18 family aminopeptidase [Nitrosomonas sp. PLL12]
MTAKQRAQHLLDFIDTSPSPWHVVASIETAIQAFQFVRLDETAKWGLQTGGRYYVVRDDSSIVLFVLGRKTPADAGFKIIGAHTDSPGLRIRPNAATASDGLARLGVEIYGGPILATFTDRDLSLAGRVSYADEQGELAHKLVRFEQPLLRLPNLAIHMNRGVNEDGLKLHKQNELPLLFAQLTGDQLPHPYFLALLAQAAGISVSQVLSWDLAVYDTQKGAFWGANQEFYANSQIDNLASCHAGLHALLDDTVLSHPESTLVCAFFDHEEIGSQSHVGAAGSFLADVLQRISIATSSDREDTARALAQSFLISADMAHAYHPNFPSAYDADHKVFINKGPVIKSNANRRYSSESISIARFIQWCEEAGIPYQRYSHRSDLPCGSTIGPMTSAKLGIRSVDVGCPMWAMHSIRESAGVQDHESMVRVLKQFFID